MDEEGDRMTVEQIVILILLLLTAVYGWAFADLITRNSKLRDEIDRLGERSAFDLQRDSRLLIEDALNAVEVYIYAASEEVPKHELYKKMIDEIMQARRDVHGWD
jgi:hypothetical protein